MPYVDRDGVKTYYETYGEGVPIVFLHPWYANGYIWYFQMFPFAQTNQCVVIDQRGHGRSDKPQQGYAIKEVARDVAAVIDELGLGKIVLVGNSIGGMIVMQFNLDFPERVLGNVIVSSGTALGKAFPPELVEALEAGHYQQVFGPLTEEGLLSTRTVRERGEIVDLMKAQFMLESNFPPHVFASSYRDPEGVFSWDITERLKEIGSPTLVLAGEEDQATTVEVNRILADGIPGAELRVIKDVGHLYQLEKPKEFNQVLREFLDRVA